MGWIIFWCILALLMIILLIPLRIPFFVNGKQWGVSIHYGLFRILQLPEQEEPPVTASAAIPEAQEQKAPSVYEKTDEMPAKEPASEQQTQRQIPDDDILPEDFPTSEPPPAKDEKPAKKTFFQRLKPSGLSDIIALAKDGLASISAPLRLLTRHLHFVKLQVNVSIATDDAAKTAITYGAVSSSAFWLLGQLQTVFDIRAEKFSIRSDFLGNKCSFSVKGELRTTPVTLLTVLLGVGIRFLVRTWLRFRREDKEQAANQKASEALAQTSASYQ